MITGSIVQPEFRGITPGEQLFDVWDAYYTNLVGPLFPKAVSLPIAGIPTEEGEVIFGRHFDVMAQREREWRVAGRLGSIVRNRIETNVPIFDDGETVISLPRTDFDELQNKMAQDGIINRGLSAFVDRSELDFPGNFDASRDLPRHTRVLADGSVELMQEHDALFVLDEGTIAAGSIFVAVRRLYGSTHQQYERDLQIVEMVLAPHSLITEEHQEHPAVIDTWGEDRTLDLSDDAIIERLNGQRPRTYDWGVVE